MLESASKHQVTDNDFERDSDGSEIERLLMKNYIETPILPEEVVRTDETEFHYIQKNFQQINQAVSPSDHPTVPFALSSLSDKLTK